ncbi:MAG: RNA polymerase sigma factor [Gemmatimonadales bacterium]
MSGPEPATAPSDRELIARWRDGDERAAAELVRRHTPAVARFLAAQGARQDLDDLVQETFFRAFRRIDSFRERASFRTWVMAIGSNALRDLGRRRRRNVLPLDDREIPDVRGDPHAAMLEGDLLGRLEGAVRELPPMQRNVFLMRAQQGAEYGEIAEALGTSVGAARVHYHHAVNRLKEALTEE